MIHFLLQLFSAMLGGWKNTILYQGVAAKIWYKKNTILERRLQLISHVCKNVNGSLAWINNYYNSEEYAQTAKLSVKLWESDKMKGTTNWNKAVHLIALYTLIGKGELDETQMNYACMKECITDDIWNAFCDHQIYFNKTEFKCAYFEKYSTDEDTCESLYEKMESITLDDESMDGSKLVYIKL